MMHNVPERMIDRATATVTRDVVVVGVVDAVVAADRIRFDEVATSVCCKALKIKL